MVHQRPAETIEDLLETIRAELGMEVAFVGEFIDGRRAFRFVAGQLEPFNVVPGESDPLEASFCYRVTQGTIPAVIPDAAKEPGTRDIAEGAGGKALGAHLGVPLYLASGRLYGTLCLASMERRNDLTEADIRPVRMMARLIARRLEEEDAENEARHRQFARVRSIIERHAYAVHFQPIVRLATGRLVGVESLTRFGEGTRPDLVFADAWAAGLGAQLELAVLAQAVEQIKDLPRGVYVSANAAPDTILSPRFLEVMEKGRTRLVLEVTEHAVVERYDLLREAIERVRALGIRLAVDDVGAGYASLTHILELQPDMLKLDRAIVADVDTDAARRALVRALVSFARGIKATVVAEQIETDAQCTMLRTLGVSHGQGYLLGKAVPAAELPASGGGAPEEGDLAAAGTAAVEFQEEDALPPAERERALADRERDRGR